MLGRWHRLEAIFNSNNNNNTPSLFKLENRDAPATDCFSGEKSYESSPAYAWVELMSESAYGGDALRAMASVGIEGRPGTLFGATRHFVRLELLMREQTFEIMCEKLQELMGRR